MAGETVITIVGNLTADPELRTIGSGATVASCTIANPTNMKLLTAGLSDRKMNGSSKLSLSSNPAQIQAWMS